MNHWAEVSLSDVCEKPQYGAIARGTSEPVGPLFVRQTDIVSGRIDWQTVPYCDLAVGEIPKYAIRTGDLLISRLGAGVGTAATVRETRDAVFAGYLVRFCVNQSVAVPEFVGHHLQSARWRDHVHGFRSGAAQPTLNAKQMGGFRFLLPSLPEQIAIESILSAFGDKIELNLRTAETLEAMARAVFKSWFVDFDPVHAKAAGRVPEWMDAETAALFPDCFGDDGLPEGWSVSSVGEHFAITMGQSPPGDTYNEDGRGIPFYQGKRDYGWRFPSLRVYCTAPSRMARAGDTLVSVRAPVGSVNLAPMECSIGRGLAAVRHKSGSSSYTYYVMLQLSAEFESYESSGTVFGSINKKQFCSLEYKAPPPAVVNAFEVMTGQLDESIRSISDQSVSLAAIRDALLPRLLSGELRVDDAEKVAEGVL
jgi:type I restriction enzyme S subunit